VLQGGKPREFAYTKADMVALGEHCSMAERRADEASWDVEAWLKCEYMQDRVGEVFDGVVKTVTSFGLFVELKDIYVEGLVHVTSLSNDYYHFDPATHCLKGERSGRRYRMGDPIRVQLAQVNLDDRKIDFIPEPGEDDSRDGKGGKSRGRKKDKAEKAAVSAHDEGKTKAKSRSGRRRSRKRTEG
jgi:ribonuclease R